MSLNHGPGLAARRPPDLPAGWSLSADGATVHIPLGKSGLYATIDADLAPRVAAVSRRWHRCRGRVRAVVLRNGKPTSVGLSRVVAPEAASVRYADRLDLRRATLTTWSAKAADAAPATPAAKVKPPAPVKPPPPPHPPSPRPNRQAARDIGPVTRAVRANERAWGVDATAGLDAAELAERPLTYCGETRPIREWAGLWGVPVFVLAHRLAAGVNPLNYPMPPVELEDPTWWSPPAEDGPPFVE